MPHSHLTAQAKTQALLADIFTEFEALLIELSEYLPTHPEKNRFAHGILNVLQDIELFRISDEIRAYQARELKAPHPVQTPVDDHYPNDDYQRENDPDDALEHVGLAARLDPYSLVELLEDYHLQALPLHRRGTPFAPLLQGERIEHLQTLWQLIKAFASEHDAQHVARIKRLMHTLMLYRTDLFNAAHLSRLFELTSEEVDQLAAGFKQLQRGTEGIFSTYRISTADVSLLLSQPAQAKITARLITWLAKNHALTEMNRAKTSHLTTSQIEMLCSLETIRFHEQTDLEFSRIVTHVLDNIDTFPNPEPNPAQKPDDEDLELSTAPTTVSVKTAELKHALALHVRLEKLYQEIKKDYHNSINDQLTDLIALSNRPEEETPLLTEGQLCRLIYITDRISDPVGYDERHDEFQAIASEATTAALANHFFTPERAEFLMLHAPGFPYHLMLASFLIDKAHLDNLAPGLDHLNLGTYIRFDDHTPIRETCAMSTIRHFLPWMLRGDENRIKTVGRALRWVDAYGIDTPERVAFIQQNPDGVAALSFRWQSESLAFNQVQALSACLFDLLKPLMLAKQAEADNIAATQPAQPEPRTIKQLVTPFLIRLTNTPKDIKHTRAEPTLHNHNPLAEVKWESPMAAEPVAAFRVKFNTVAESENLSHVEIQITRPNESTPFVTLLDEAGNDHEKILVSADYLVCSATEDIAKEPPAFDQYLPFDAFDPDSQESKHAATQASGTANPINSESRFLEMRTHWITTEKRLYFWNLNTATCVYQLPYVSHTARHKQISENKLIITMQGTAHQYDLKTHTCEEIYRSLTDMTHQPIEIMDKFNGRVLLKSESELILVKNAEHERTQHYQANISEIKILDEHRLLYTKAHQRRGGQGRARGLVTLPPDTTVFLLLWDPKTGFAYDRKWRVPQEVHGMTVTRDNVLLFTDKNSVFALDLEDREAKAVQLWTAGHFNGYGVYLKLVSETVLKISATDTFYYETGKLKGFLREMGLGEKRIKGGMNFFKETPQEEVTHEVVVKTSLSQ